MFPESGGRIKLGALCCLFCCPGHNNVLLNEVFDGVGPVLVARFLPLLHHQVFEDVGLVDACDKLRDFVVVSDGDLVFFGVVLLSCEVVGVCVEVLVGGVTPGGDEGGLRCHPFSVGNYGPCAEVSDKQQDGFVFKLEVVHLFFFDVLGHDGGDNCVVFCCE